MKTVPSLIFPTSVWFQTFVIWDVITSMIMLNIIILVMTIIIYECHFPLLVMGLYSDDREALSFTYNLFPILKQTMVIMINKIHVNYIPSFINDSRVTPVMGTWRTPCMCSFSCLFYHNPCWILHNFPVKKICAFSVSLICSLCSDVHTSVCIWPRGLILTYILCN
jgi:hypothetical protein